MSYTKRELQWILVFTIWVSLIVAFGNPRPVAAEKKERTERKLVDDYSGIISIDCGVNEDYTDNSTNIRYQADHTSFVDSGEIYLVSSNYTFDNEPQISKQLRSLRSFPDGKRNCYNLKPKQGINNNYLIRVYFAYGNYDGKDQIPIFDLYFGVNYWTTIDGLDDASTTLRTELAVLLSLTDVIDVCLVNTGQGVPFISLLEVWPLTKSLYQTTSTLLPLELITRRNLGVSGNVAFTRYTDDPFGRSWGLNGEISSSESLNTTLAINTDDFTYDSYRLPTEVLRTAVTPLSPSTSLDLIFDYDNSSEYYAYLHFFDFEADNYQLRIMDILYNDNSNKESFTLSPWFPYTSVLNFQKGRNISFSVTATSKSELPAMLNAFEIYRVLPQPTSATDPDDVDAIRNIKSTYDITRISWQGDPCIPKNFTWEGLTCNSDNNPRVISLNLRSSTLTGDIAASFSNLTKLEILDLSNNTLTGEVPEFLAELPNLKLLNLSRNNLTGSIPKALKDKTTTSNLLLSLDGNPGLCLTDSCSKSESSKSSVTVVVATTASVTAFLIIVFISVMLRRRKRNKQRVMSTTSRNDGQLNLKNRAFSQSDILSITENFKTVIGEGGFGKVYLGCLQNGKQLVAVKLLSESSKQGNKEFRSEAELLMVVHHRNLVSLVGYCDEGDIKALVYEYMTMGNLQQQLSDKNPNVLKWNERLRIALDAASGLDYLHNGCRPPIVHRDLKTSNILLSENKQAKIADFGLSRAFANDIDTHVLTQPVGTPGYFDPEFQSSGNLNKKSDVYSFGVILLELITGKPAIIERSPENFIHIAQWVTQALKSGDIEAIVDPRLEGTFTTASAWKFIEIATSCIPQTALQRPDISPIVTELKECLALEASLETTDESESMRSSATLEITSLTSFHLESDIGPYVR